jgi:hypothetical protein
MLVLRTSVLKQTHFAVRGAEPPDQPSSARRLPLKAQVVAASIDVARGSNVRPQGRRLQNKPNLSLEGPAGLRGPETDRHITVEALLPCGSSLRLWFSPPNQT